MPSLNMEGPYPLTEQFINAHIINEAIGNYALGIAHNRQFAVQYVGRSDTDLKRRLAEHIGEPYTYFMFSYAENVVQAYQKECVNYHDYVDPGYRLDNEIHPDKPEGRSDLRCPRCKA
jgi:hypothetical protein